MSVRLRLAVSGAGGIGCGKAFQFGNDLKCFIIGISAHVWRRLQADADGGPLRPPEQLAGVVVG